MIILDASAVVSILLNTGPEAEPIRERIESPGESVHVPHLLDVEVLSVLRRQTLRGIIAKERSATALQDLENTKMTTTPTPHYLVRSGSCEKTSPPTTRLMSRSPRRSTRH